MHRPIDLEFGAPIPMTADGSVIWRQFELADLDALLYVSPSCTPDALWRTIEVATGIGLSEENLHDEGGVSKVYQVETADQVLAIKRTDDELVFDELHEGLSALRVNVALEHGFKRLWAPWSQRPHATTLLNNGLEIGYRFSTPTYYALFVPNTDPKDTDMRASLTMSFVNGQPASENLFPPKELHEHVFDAALLSTGLDPKLANHDMYLGSPKDPHDKNLLFLPLSGGRFAKRTIQAVKIDSCARDIIDF